MNIQTHHSLSSLNSFGFSVKAAHYVEVSTDEELIEALATADKENWPVFLLGGGSNLVLTQDIDALVIHPVNQSTHYERQADGTTLVTAHAGKTWHELVLETLDQGLAGLENLSLIPGNTGAAPVQNIGAYGVELVDRLHSVRAYHRPSAEWKTLAPSDCQFAYRDSVFKRNPNEYVITEVVFKLAPTTKPVAHYAALKNALDEQPMPDDNVARAKLISNTVIRIRQSKLPDPAKLGNAGSFFKNPVVTEAHANSLLKTHPKLVHYPQENGQVKLAAGWLIDSLGFKGRDFGGVGVHADQALVLVHRGGASGADLMALAHQIIDQVQTTFDVSLEIEPVVV